jgi:hypothetical protein
MRPQRTVALALLLACVSYALANDAELLWAGHRSLAAGDYAKALDSYRTAKLRGSQFGGLGTFIEIIEERQRLGAITPGDTHRICALLVTEIRDVPRRGEPKPRRDLTPTELEQWRIYLAILPRIIESYSGGRWTLDIDVREIAADVPEGTTLRPANPDHLGLGRFFYDTVDRYDTYMVFSSAISPAYGLARRYPFVEGVLYGPHRGVVDLGAHPSLLTLVHEFFHVVEWASGGIGGPAHGFEPGKRQAFPDWKGDDELDYYRWHFRTTLPRIGWQKLALTRRFVPVPERSRAALERVEAVYAKVPLVDRLEAKRLTEEAQKRLRKDPAEAQRMLEQALALSPYLPEAIERLQALHRAQGREPAAEALAAKLAETRAVAGFRDTLATP